MAHSTSLLVYSRQQRFGHLPNFAPVPLADLTEKYKKTPRKNRQNSKFLETSNFFPEKNTGKLQEFQVSKNLRARNAKGYREKKKAARGLPQRTTTSITKRFILIVSQATTFSSSASRANKSPVANTSLEQQQGAQRTQAAVKRSSIQQQRRGLELAWAHVHVDRRQATNASPAAVS